MNTLFGAPGSTLIYGRVRFDPADSRIYVDHVAYAQWSVRAKMMMLDGATNPISIRGRLEMRNYDTYRKTFLRYGKHNAQGARRREKYVRRAVMPPFRKAVRDEMRTLVVDMAARHDWMYYRPPTWWDKLFAALRGFRAPSSRP